MRRDRRAAYAQDSAIGAQRTISYTDLDLSTVAGVAALDARLSQAVSQVCGTADLRDLGRWQAIKTCRAETQARVAASRSTLLTAARTHKDTRPTRVAAK